MDYLSKKIIIVESNAKNSEILQAVFMAEGYTHVDLVDNGQACFDKITDTVYDLLVVGQFNDNDSKLAFLQGVRESFSKQDLGVLCLVKVSDDTCITQLMNLGVQDYIVKPLVTKELLLRTKVLLVEANDGVDDVFQAFEENKNSAVGEMISMIAHQWRQPLSSMGAAVSRVEIDLLTESLSNDDLQKTCNDMKSTIAYLSETIDDFRYFFTPSKERETTSLQEIVSRTQSIISISLAHNRITLIVDDPLIDVGLSLYVSEVIQVLINILNNATDELIERHIPKPCIWISSAKIGSFVTLSIRDNAGGISEDVISKIFDPYFSTKKKKNGSGLGLYMARNIIQRHCNGTITARNSDDGAEFMIKIPIHIEEG